MCVSMNYACHGEVTVEWIDVAATCFTEIYGPAATVADPGARLLPLA